MDRQSLASLWARLIAIPREAIFDSPTHQLPPNLQDDARVLAPGLVGRDSSGGSHWPAAV